MDERDEMGPGMLRVWFSSVMMMIVLSLLSVVAGMYVAGFGSLWVSFFG